jgi:hypothetical protein
MVRISKLGGTGLLVILLLLLAVMPAFAGEKDQDGESTPVKKALTFRAMLTGAEEVPPVDTAGHGQALFRFSRTLKTMDYKLAVFGLKDVFAAHIHCAPKGVNGPVGVTLYMGDPVSPDGLLAQARISAPNPGNACGWETLADVAAALGSGDAYVNVHTLAHPAGEIRGQIH